MAGVWTAGRNFYPSPALDERTVHNPQGYLFTGWTNKEKWSFFGFLQSGVCVCVCACVRACRRAGFERKTAGVHSLSHSRTFKQGLTCLSFKHPHAQSRNYSCCTDSFSNSATTHTHTHTNDLVFSVCKHGLTVEECAPEIPFSRCHSFLMVYSFVNIFHILALMILFLSVLRCRPINNDPCVSIPFGFQYSGLNLIVSSLSSRVSCAHLSKAT